MPESRTKEEIEITPAMIEAGAFALLDCYSGPTDSAFEASRRVLEAAFRTGRQRQNRNSQAS